MIRKGQLQRGSLDSMRPELSTHGRFVVHLYQMMGGLTWEAMPFMMEMYGDQVDDTEFLIECLAMIRDKMPKSPF